MTKTLNKNPNGINQWIKRTDEEIQTIINKHPNFTKKDFRGEGKLNSRKILTRKETERPSLVFGKRGKSRQSLKDIYKYSTQESILEFEEKLIDEKTLRNRARTKKQRDLMPNYKKRALYKIRHANLTESELELKRQRDRIYKESLKVT